MSDQFCKCGQENLAGVAVRHIGGGGWHSKQVCEGVPKRVAPSAETREVWKCRCGSRNLGPGNICHDCRDVRTSPSLPPAATNCCTATEVEAARNPEKSLEERAQEAAEEIYAKVIDDSYEDSGYQANSVAKVKAIILSRIGGAE
jgi:hypothetical protein